MLVERFLRRTLDAETGLASEIIPKLLLSPNTAAP